MKDKLSDLAIDNIVISVANATKNIEKKQILNNVSFTIAKRERICIIGPSGSGKSTLLSCMAGITNLDSGHIITNGLSILVYQHPTLFHHMNIFNNLVYPAIKVHGQNAQKTIELACEYMQFCGLTSTAELSVSQISGGQKQKLCIIRAFLIMPTILLLDEPTSSLDNESAITMSQLLLQLQNKHETTIVFTTHESNLAQNIASRIIKLENGNIETGTYADKILK